MPDYDFHPIVYNYDDFTPEELEAMRASLKKVGLLQAIVVWKNQIVDGKHREILCREERVNRTYRDITSRCQSEEEMREYVRALNQHRRSRTTPLTNEEKNAKAEAAVKADPKLADTAISQKLGDVSQPTVYRARKRLESKGVIPRITRVVKKFERWARAITPPLDGNNAGAHPIAHGIAQARCGGRLYRWGTAGRCPSPDDCAQHGNARRIRSGRAARSARRRGLPWTSTPPLPT
jgi:hypothetical protein